MLKTTAGRAFAAMPKSTSQTSPCLALNTVLLLLVVCEKGLLGRRDQVGFSHNAVRIIANDSVVALTILLMHSLLDTPEFLGRQLRQHGFNFHNSAHSRQSTKQTAMSQAALPQYGDACLTINKLAETDLARWLKG